jgi:hypothetical protein
MTGSKGRERSAHSNLPAFLCIGRSTINARHASAQVLLPASVIGSPGAVFFGTVRLRKSVIGLISGQESPEKAAWATLGCFPTTIPHPNRQSTTLTAENFAGGCTRQLQVKNRSMRTVRRGPELAAMRFNNRAANRKAHPHATILRRKEGVKDAIHMSRINSSPGVL